MYTGLTPIRGGREVISERSSAQVKENKVVMKRKNDSEEKIQLKESSKEHKVPNNKIVRSPKHNKQWIAKHMTVYLCRVTVMYDSSDKSCG